MIDFVAGGLELTALYAVGNKKRYSFLLGVLVDLLWMYVAITARIYGLLLVVIPAMVLNIRNYVKWGRESKVE